MYSWTRSNRISSLAGWWLGSGLLLVACFPLAARAADIQWANAAGGSWGDPANWSPAQVPTTGDRALITLSGTYTVTVSVDDAPVVDEFIIGGAAGQQTLVLEDNASVSVLGPVQVGGSVIVRLGVGAGFSANGNMQNLGRIEATSAQLQADLGLENSGVIELTGSQVSGSVTNHGTVRTTGMVFFSTFVNESGGSLEVFTGAGIFPGAGMDTLVNRGHVAVGTSATLIAGGWLSNEPSAVFTLAGGAATNARNTVNAGLLRVAAGAQLAGDFQQLPSGDLEAHYSVSAVAFCVFGQTAALDGTLTPIFEAGFLPPAGNLPLIFAETVSGQFAIVNQAGTNKRPVRVLYLDRVYLQVFDRALAVFPSSGGDSGTLTMVITGSQLTTVLAARLRRAGESDIVADPVIRDPATGIVNARFDLTGATHGTWDVVLDGPSDVTETAAGVFTIEATIQEPVRIEVYGRDKLRFGSSSDWSISITNPSNVDADGALQIVVPGGLGWELSIQHRGAEVASGVAGQFDESTTLIVPGLALPPGITITGLRIRLAAPAVPTVPSVTLQARWYQE